MSFPARVSRLFIVLLVGFGLVASQASHGEAEQGSFAPPAEDDIPTGPLGEAIRYGHQLLTQTQVYAKAYIDNGLNCTSCHLNVGRAPSAAPWVGIWGVFPDYNPRSGRIITLQDRINA